jgi:hypothetical protein
MNDAVEAAIEGLRDKLIDLSVSNRLLNFRHGAGISGSQSVLLSLRPIRNLNSFNKSRKALTVSGSGRRAHPGVYLDGPRLGARCGENN